MRVESLSGQEKSKTRFIVRFEDDSEIKVSPAQIADFGLYTGRELTDDEYRQIKDAIELSNAKARAIRILGNRNLSKREIQKRLMERGSTEAAADEAVQWLEETGLINDEKYAGSIVEYYTSKGYGPAKVRDELFKRGIQRETLNEVMSSLDADETAAFGFIEKKLKGSRERADISSVTTALQRRGFSYETARNAVSRFIAETDEPECGIE